MNLLTYQRTGFYMTGTLFVKGLTIFHKKLCKGAAIHEFLTRLSLRYINFTVGLRIEKNKIGS